MGDGGLEVRPARGGMELPSEPGSAHDQCPEQQKSLAGHGGESDVGFWGLVRTSAVCISTPLNASRPILTKRKDQP